MHTEDSSRRAYIVGRALDLRAVVVGDVERLRAVGVRALLAGAVAAVVVAASSSVRCSGGHHSEKYSPEADGLRERVGRDERDVRAADAAVDERELHERAVLAGLAAVAVLEVACGEGQCQGKLNAQ